MDKPEIVRVLEVRRETPSVCTLVLDKKVRPQYGQFFMLWIPGVGEKPYACSRFGGNMEVTVKKAGPFSERLSAIKKGDLVGIRGPYGEGHFRVEGKRLCFIAGGLGIVPLIPVLEGMRDAAKSACVILGAKTEKELVCVDRIKKTGAELFIATDDGSAGDKGFCHEVFLKTLEKKNFDQVLCCGPEAMMYQVLDTVLEKKIPAQFSLERYMKCGIGICGSCALDPMGVLVCRDGPVFRAEQLRGTEFGKHRRDAAGSKTKV
jgi:dihydroorotate dehydrogenase electron transfer subunit